MVPRISHTICDANQRQHYAHPNRYIYTERDAIALRDMELDRLVFGLSAVNESQLNVRIVMRRESCWLAAVSAV